MNDSPSISLGLAGDGDEVEAIENVERAFAVKLDAGDAPSWVTAGDVFDSLQETLPVNEISSATLWKRFAESLTLKTGVDAKKIDRNSPLLVASSFSWQLALGHVGIAALMLFGLLVLFSLIAPFVGSLFGH